MAEIQSHGLDLVLKAYDQFDEKGHKEAIEILDSLALPKESAKKSF